MQWTHTDPVPVPVHSEWLPYLMMAPAGSLLILRIRLWGISMKHKQRLEKPLLEKTGSLPFWFEVAILGSCRPLFCLLSRWTCSNDFVKLNCVSTTNWCKLLFRCVRMFSNSDCWRLHDTFELENVFSDMLTPPQEDRIHWRDNKQQLQEGLCHLGLKWTRKPLLFGDKVR